MGSGLSFTVNADSIADAGQKSVVSAPIEGVDAAKLVQGMEKYVRAGKTALGSEAKFEVAEHSGGALTTQTWDIPALFGGGLFVARQVWMFQADGLELVTYPTQGFWDRQTPATTSTIKVHQDPGVIVECWTQVHEARASGRVIKAAMDKILEALDSKAATHDEADSVTEQGLKSVVSDPIEDNAKANADNFLEVFKEVYLLDAMGCTAIPDGTVVEDRASLGEFFGVGAKSFAKHEFDAKENRAICHEFGADESLTDLLSTTYTQVHRNPFRLEQWNVTVPCRRANDGVQKVVEPFVKGVLSYLEEQAA